MAGTRTGTPFKRYGMPVLCVGIICLLCWLMKVAFALPSTTLLAALPKSAGPGTHFDLADGSSFAGDGKILVDGEALAYERVTPDDKPVANGSDTLKFPSHFKVIERGANGTVVVDHAAGSKVGPVATGLFFPENNATFGEQVDELFYLILWITGIAFILTEGFWLYCVVMFWAKPGERAVCTHGNHKLELAWTAVPAVILIALAIVQSGMWTEMKMSAPSATEPGVVTIQGVAKQFEWNFRHAGKDGTFGTADDIPQTGELVVPVDTPIRMEFRSMDVIHAFFLPNFRVKQDVVPGLSIPVWYRAKNPGIFQIMCAELCGYNHTTMRGKLIVKSKADYLTWVDEKSKRQLEENDGIDRPEWSGVQMKTWWWWDCNAINVGFSGEGKKKRP